MQMSVMVTKVQSEIEYKRMIQRQNNKIDASYHSATKYIGKKNPKKSIVARGKCSDFEKV